MYIYMQIHTWCAVPCAWACDFIVWFSFYANFARRRALLDSELHSRFVETSYQDFAQTLREKRGRERGGEGKKLFESKCRNNYWAPFPIHWDEVSEAWSTCLWSVGRRNVYLWDFTMWTQKLAYSAAVVCMKVENSLRMHQMEALFR